MVWNGIDSSSAIRAASSEVREHFVKQHLDTSGPISFALHTSTPECTSHNGTPTSASDGSIFKPSQRAQQVHQTHQYSWLHRWLLDCYLAGWPNSHCMLVTCNRKKKHIRSNLQRMRIDALDAQMAKCALSWLTIQSFKASHCPAWPSQAPWGRALSSPSLTCSCTDLDIDASHHDIMICIYAAST